MKRLGIFCFYDKAGVVDSYVEYLLSELMTVLDKLIIVANGEVNEGGKYIFSRYTSDLIIRENRGFDGGAYADVIVNVLGDRIRDWDELILCNDTFFGPFVPMKAIFVEMEGKRFDFWGLNVSERGLMTHVHSYFLVFSAKILQNGDLTEYFRDNINFLADDVMENCGKFEHRLFLHLTGKHYSYGAYCDTESCCVFKSSDICMGRYGLPILKKKAFLETYNPKAVINAVRYVRYNTNYDIGHISRHVRRVYGLSLGQETLSEYIPPSLDEAAYEPPCRFSGNELDTYISDRDFYIYGTGWYGRFLYYIHLYKHKGLKGFVISDSERIEKPLVCGLPVFHYGEIDKNSLVVLGVGKKLTEFLKPRLDKRTEYIELW